MKKLSLIVGMLFLFVAFASAQNVAKRTANLTSTQFISLKSLSATPQVATSNVDNNSVVIQRKDGTMENLAWLMQQDPTLQARMQAEENKFNDYISSHQSELENNKTVYTLPVVVHLVYKSVAGTNNDAGDITDAMVAEQIVQTNKDWAGTNGRSMQAFSTSLQANANITLCLATKDASGNATTGVTRTTTTVTSFSMNNAVKSSSTGGKTGWDYTKFLNIWVCDMDAFDSNSDGEGLCGYAQFPTSGINSTYGVVIDYKCFGLSSAFGGTSTTATAPFNGGGTLSHEFGHCFNLYHIWGDENACTGTDNCTDTPNQASACSNNGSWTGVHTDICTTTSPGIMYMNFMDYSDDIKYANVTPNQVTRMQSAVGSYLTSVNAYSATACNTTPLAPVANFSANATNVTPGTTVSFTDLSTNTPTSWAWTFGDGGTSTIKNPTHLYSAVGVYTVVLTATNAVGSNTCTKTSYITVNTATAGCDTIIPTSFTTPTCSLAVYVQDAIAPYDSGYIAGQNAWLDKEKAMLYTGVANGTVSDVFVLYALKGGTTGSTSVKIYSSTAGAPGTLLGTSAAIAKSAIDTTNHGVNFGNKYHFATPVSAAADYYVSVVLPTGFTNGTNTLAIWSATYTCATTTEYEMWSDNSWNDYITVYGANIDMAIFPVVCTTVGNNEVLALENNVQLFPNPTSDQFTVLFTGEKQKDVLVNIYNAMGSLVKSITSNDMTDNVVIDMNDVAKGIYIVNIKTNQGTVIKKLSLIK